MLMARLASGAFTPFLLPVWGEAERRAVATWRYGADEGVVDDLEAALAERLGLGWHAKAVGSGRAALLWILRGLGLPSNSEVIVPSFSCTGVVDPVRKAGLSPVLADIDEDLNLSFDGVLSADGPDVRAIIVPHLGGVRNASGAQIRDWADRRGIIVVEDACHALGLEGVGSIGDFVIFSFGLGKPLFGPGGGAVASKRDLSGMISPPPADLKRQTKRWRHFRRLFLTGTTRRGWGELWQRVRPSQGEDVSEWNGIGKLDAAVALAQISRVDETVAARRENAVRWRRLLAACDLEKAARMAPATHNSFTKAWLAIDARTAGVWRRELRYMGVETEALYTPLHLRAGYTDCRRGLLPRTEALWQGVFSLPVRPNLTSTDWRRIAEAVKRLSREIS